MLRKEENVDGGCIGNEVLSGDDWEDKAEADQEGESTGSSSSNDKEKD
jgi:hypothetical protein